MGDVVWNETEGQVQDRLRAKAARLEGELAGVQKELESKDEELRLAREDFSPEAWEDLLQRLEKSEAAIRAKDTALRDAYASAHATYMSKELFPNTHHSGGFADCPTTLCINRRAALSPDAGKGCDVCGVPWEKHEAPPYECEAKGSKGWLPPDKVTEARRNVCMIDASPAGSLNAQYKSAALDALKGVE